MTETDLSSDIKSGSVLISGFVSALSQAGIKQAALRLYEFSLGSRIICVLLVLAEAWIVVLNGNSKKQCFYYVPETNKLPQLVDEEPSAVFFLLRWIDWRSLFQPAAAFEANQDKWAPGVAPLNLRVVLGDEWNSALRLNSNQSCRMNRMWAEAGSDYKKCE